MEAVATAAVVEVEAMEAAGAEETEDTVEVVVDTAVIVEVEEDMEVVDTVAIAEASEDEEVCESEFRCISGE